MPCARPATATPLDGLGVERVLAVGESQSAFALTTYVNGVQPLSGAFDGFLIHSRGGASAPLGEPDEGIEIAGTIGGEPTTIRADGEAPAIIVQTESDVLGLLGYLPARQPDDETLRLWEVAGTAHADKFQVGDAEDMLGCAQPINRGPAGLRAAGRAAPPRHVGAPTAPRRPRRPRLDVDEAARTAFVLDEVGNVTGGVRTPGASTPRSTCSRASRPRTPRSSAC